MDEVSCKATLALLEAASSVGIAEHRLTRGLGPDGARLRDPRARIDWADFAQLMENLAAAAPAPGGLERLGAELLVAPSIARPLALAALGVTTRQMYSACFTRVAPSLFRTLRFDLRDTGDPADAQGASLELTLRIPDHLAPSAPFARLCAGVFGAIPRLARLPASPVTAQVATRHALLMARLPPPEPLLGRLRRRARARLAGDAEPGPPRSPGPDHRATLAMLARLPAGVLVHRGGVILYANAAFARSIGAAAAHDADRLVGARVRDVVREACHADAPPDAGLEGDAPVEIRLAGRRGDTSPAWYVLEPGGELAYGGAPARVHFARDTTEARSLGDHVRAAERMASIGAIAAGVAHEINNPLAYIHASLEVLARAVERCGPQASPADVEAGRERVRAAIEVAQDGVGRVRDIVADLKTLSRADEVTLSPVDVRALLDATLALAASHLETRVTVERDYRAAPRVLANRARLGQVFLNLLVNAADAATSASPATPTTPTTPATPARVRVRTGVTADGRVEIAVSDTGPGIDAEAAPRLFEPFFTTKPLGVGTGLGLAICQRIVTELGGEIRVQSETLPGSGAAACGDGYRTTFAVLLAPAKRE